MRKLERLPDVRTELAARAEYAKLDALPDLRRDGLREAIKDCAEIASKYPATPTARRAVDLAKELALLPAPTPPAAAPAFVIRIENFYGAEGFFLLYKVTPDEIAVGSISEWASVRPREQYRVPLSAEQRDGIQRFLRDFPLKGLDDRYMNSSVNDGFQCTFDLQIGRAPRRSIHVENRRVEPLEALRRQVNQLVPDKLKINGGSSFQRR
jgi:hypothetical protein